MNFLDSHVLFHSFQARLYNRRRKHKRVVMAVVAVAAVMIVVAATINDATAITTASTARLCLRLRF